MFIKVLKKGIVSKMRVCLRSLSCVQAHHTVWRKLRQRAEKLVGATDNTHFLCTHSPQRQRHQSCSAEAKLEEEDFVRASTISWLTHFYIPSDVIEEEEWLHPPCEGQTAIFQNFTSKLTLIPSPDPGRLYF